MKSYHAVIPVLLAGCVASPARADVIDFNTTLLGALGAGIVTATNTVTFSVGAGAPGACCAHVADVGGPTTAFVPSDTPFDGMATSGPRFLTDEPSGPSATLNYFMTFLNPIFNLSLHLYDYRTDGGPGRGDMAVLTVYSDLFTTAVGSSTFTIPLAGPLPVDGNIELLSVLLPSAPISSAALRFVDGPDGDPSGADVGTGIDNITFTTVPEPGTLLLLGSGLTGLALRRRRRNS